MFFNFTKNITLVVLKFYKMLKYFVSIFGLTLLLSVVSINANTEKEKTKINQLIDKWHKDVANYNLNDYFELMDSTFIFLGTAPNERWTKKEFFTFCKPYFDKQSTWNFTPLKRTVYFNDDYTTAWFEEELQTWMESCRGSGVLLKRKTGWKLAHYNLTVLIENEKIKKFIKLRKKK